MKKYDTQMLIKPKSVIITVMEMIGDRSDTFIVKCSKEFKYSGFLNFFSNNINKKRKAQAQEKAQAWADEQIRKYLG